MKCGPAIPDGIHLRIVSDVASTDQAVKSKEPARRRLPRCSKRGLYLMMVATKRYPEVEPLVHGAPAVLDQPLAQLRLHQNSGSLLSQVPRPFSVKNKRI